MGFKKVIQPNKDYKSAKVVSSNKLKKQKS